MKLGIMQPYAFAYLGYFQLINAADLFVLYDDVAFEKQGWVNRNVLGARHGPQRFTLPVCKPRLGQTIIDMRLHEAKSHQRRLLKTVETLYRRAPYYEHARPVLERAIKNDNDNLASYVCHSLEVLNEYLGLATPLLRSSEISHDRTLTGQQRVIEICRAQGAATYLNAEGGMQLYEEAVFKRQGVDLLFLVHETRPYRQNSSEFLPRLSIIDVMMFNSRQEIARLLGDYRLVRAADGT